MTVAKMIELLRRFPQDAEVEACSGQHIAPCGTEYTAVVLVKVDGHMLEGCQTWSMNQYRILTTDAWSARGHILLLDDEAVIGRACVYLNKLLSLPVQSRLSREQLYALKGVEDVQVVREESYAVHR